MINTFYLNLDKTTRPCSLEEWGNQLEEMRKSNTKHVADEIVNGLRVSTVWLGLNHDFSELGQPLLFETMIFPEEGRDSIELYLDRYATWQEAEEGHKKAVEWVKDECND